MYAVPPAPTPPRLPAILVDAARNRGPAFSAAERDALGLTGRLPPVVLTLEEQSQRVYTQLESQPDNLARSVFLERLHDRNETLYFKLLSDHLAELLPVVEGCATDEAIGRYPDEYGSPRGIYLSIDRPGDIEKSFATLGLGTGDVDVIVCSDAEQVPRIGDRGGGGMRTAAGKLAAYTAGAGIHPHRVIPVSLDVGTDNETLLSDPFYLGNRHARRRGQDYDAFIERYVQTVSALFPDALLHFEDLSPENARKARRTYGHRYRVLTGVQGTGAVVLAAVYAAIRATGIPMKHQELVVFGAGVAGVGLADQLRAAMIADGATDEQARSQIWLADAHGLLFDDMDELRDFQRDYAKQRSGAPGASGPGAVGLADIIEGVAPTILVGASALGGTFTREVVQAMCQATRRPLIVPLSAPAAAIEAMPADIIAWSDGKALVATGIQSDPVEWNGTTFTVGQLNDVLVYPGLGLGIIASRAAKVTPRMLQAAAAALAEQVDASQLGAPLLPGIHGLRASSPLVAEAVVRAAVADQVAVFNPTNPAQAIRDAMWRPAYPDVVTSP
jgi:malate dehydrogenase (oxaloacetate-decarboxylating)